jgi:hypothetical protein
MPKAIQITDSIAESNRIQEESSNFLEIAISLIPFGSNEPNIQPIESICPEIENSIRNN